MLEAKHDDFKSCEIGSLIEQFGEQRQSNMKIDLHNLEITGERLENSDKNLSICIMGDWSPASGGISDIVIKRQESFYDALQPYLNESDLNIANLETVIDHTDRHVDTGGIRFIDKKEVLSSLQAANIKLVCLANNHIMDNDKKGVEQTIKYLRECSICHVGAGLYEKEIYSPFTYEKNGVKIAVINAADGEYANEKYNDGIGAADIESYRVIDSIRKYKRKGYFILVVLHAGAEFVPIPPPYIVKQYRTFVLNGADLVVGHHPHVVQGIEIFKNVPIVYSLGHFGIFRSKGREKEKEGLLINLSIGNEGLEKCILIPFHITKNGIKKLSASHLDRFVKNLKIISKSITEDKTLHEIWALYVHQYYPIINIKRILCKYLHDESASRILAKRLFIANSTKHIYLTHSNNHQLEFKHIELLKEYGSFRKLKYGDIIFIRTRNILRGIYLSLSTKRDLIRKQILKIKRGITI